jgi:hypothetical protein
VKVFAEYTKTAGHGEDSYEREFFLTHDVNSGNLSGAWNGQLIGGKEGEFKVTNERNDLIELRFITKRAPKVRTGAAIVGGTSNVQ